MCSFLYLFIVYMACLCCSAAPRQSIPIIAETGCGAMAALTLRVPDNSAAFAENSVASLLIDILKNHRLKVAVEVGSYII